MAGIVDNNILIFFAIFKVKNYTLILKCWNFLYIDHYFMRLREQR